jgi:hypothetical protein
MDNDRRKFAWLGRYWPLYGCCPQDRFCRRCEGLLPNRWPGLFTYAGARSGKVAPEHRKRLSGRPASGAGLLRTRHLVPRASKGSRLFVCLLSQSPEVGLRIEGSAVEVLGSRQWNRRMRHNRAVVAAGQLEEGGSKRRCGGRQCGAVPRRSAVEQAVCSGAASADVIAAGLT